MNEEEKKKWVNQIVQGDALETIRKIPEDFVNCTITSPPYNMRTRIRNGEYTSREKSEHFSKKYEHFGDDLPIEEYYSYHKEVISELLKKSKIIFYNIQLVTGSKEAIFRIIGDFSRQIKDIIIWDKKFGQPAMHENVLNSCYELIIIFENDNKAGRVIQNSFFKRGKLDNIWRIGRGKNISSEHTAVFPEKLVTTILNNFTQEGDVVLDCFMGVGTTALACVKLRRNFIGIDISPEYCSISQKRLGGWLQQKTLQEV